VDIRDPEERRQRTLQSMSLATETRELIETRANIPVEIISGGGTGTYDISGVIDGVDEIQAGSYALMDHFYQGVRPEFQLALSVLVTVISTPGPARAVLDVGLKGVGAEFGPPIILGRPHDSVPSFKSEEHTIARVADEPLHVGDKLRLVPSHGCTTCNLHRWIYAARNGVVEEVWPIEGSGCLS